MTETLAYGYSSESTQGELSHEYQYDRVSLFMLLAPLKSTDYHFPNVAKTF